VFLVCCVGSGLSDELITRAEESCRLRVGSGNLNSKAVYVRVGLLRHIEKEHLSSYHQQMHPFITHKKC